MPGGVFDQEEVFSKFGSSEGYNYNSSQGHADDDGSETDDDEEDESSTGPNREQQKFKGKYHRLRKYIKELMFVSKVLFFIDCRLMNEILPYLCLYSGKRGIV